MILTFFDVFRLFLVNFQLLFSFTGHCKFLDSTYSTNKILFHLSNSFCFCTVACPFPFGSVLLLVQLIPTIFFKQPFPGNDMFVRYSFQVCYTTSVLEVITNRTVFRFVPPPVCLKSLPTVQFSGLLHHQCA